MGKKLLKLFLKVLSVLMVFIVLFVIAVNYGIFGHLYSKSEISEFKNETASLVFSEDGQLLGKFFNENRTNISFNQLPDFLVNALIATEDARYFDHEGIDSRSLVRVLIKTVLLNQKSAGGGSTITQQLAKNMYGRKRFGPLTIPVNKTKEALLANRIEEIFTKEEILSLYLNTVPFGENVYGIEAASRRFFNKSVEELKMEEASLLIGMLKANTYYNPRLYPEHALKRRNVVLSQMQKYDYLTENEEDSVQNLPLNLDYANLESIGIANYFLVHVKKRAQGYITEYNKKNGSKYDLEKDGLIIRTTLNGELQNDALQAFKSHLSKMQKLLDKQYRSGNSRKHLYNLVNNQLKNTKATDVLKQRELFSWEGFYSDSISIKDSLAHVMRLLHAGMFAINPQNGNVLIYVGGIDHHSQPYDQVLARRQMASSFKPILYAAALEEGYSPCDYLDNDSIVLSDHDNWSPENYDHSTGGNYSLAASLKKSLNIPTVNLFFEVGFESLDYLWEKMGFKKELSNSPATALGTGEANLFETAIAYSVFANGGDLISPRLILSIESSDGTILYQAEAAKKKSNIIADRTSELINAMLQNAILAGTGVAMASKYGVRLPLAGKTGSSQNYSDAWFIAYNPGIVIATRVGASSPAIHFNKGAYGSGSRLALPLIGLTLNSAQKKKESKKLISRTFRTLSSELQSELDCPDYREDSGFEKIMDIFKKEAKTQKKRRKQGEKKKKKSTRKKKKKKKKKKKGFFKRIFD
jgi:penicillin-binding protein 1A